MDGLFCANFASSRGCWSACLSVYCGKCYKPKADDRFHVHKPTDRSGFQWGPKVNEDRFMHARNGDHLMTTFQCDLCVFRNLTGRNPIRHSLKDQLLQVCIRRCNLDALWGRERATVDANRRSLAKTILLWDKVGIIPPLPALGPFPLEDKLGYSVAIAMLLKSLEEGKYANYQQFETIRSLRSAFSNLYLASVDGAYCQRSVGRETSKLFFTESPTQSLFFERFATGCKRRMGQEVRQDLAMSLDVMHALMEELEKDWQAANARERRLIAMLGAYAVIAFCGTFRGHEVFLVDLDGLIFYAGTEDYVIIPLLGRYKGEDHERFHLTPLASVTDSGLQVQLWVERLIEVRIQRGETQGPAFRDDKGNMTKPKIIEDGLLERLARIQLDQENHPDVIDKAVNVSEEYGISRSFRRGATTEARNRGVPREDVELMNRWRSVENSRGCKPRMRMQDHYSDIKLLIPSLIRFSQAL